MSVISIIIIIIIIIIVVVVVVVVVIVVITQSVIESMLRHVVKFRDSGHLD
jgi:hypothetical protein